MPQHIGYDEERIDSLVFQKQANEVELAFDLLEIFNKTEGLINPLRQLASFAIDEMLTLRPDNLEERKILMQAWNKESSIEDLIKRPSWQSPRQWREPKKRFRDPWSFLKAASANVVKLRAEECSDAVRLYGEVVEKGANLHKDLAKAPHDRYLPGRQKSAADRYAELDQIKSARRKGGDDVWKVGRSRKFAENQQVPKGPARNLILAQKGGINVWALKDASTIYKIDRAFGVVEGADISGTTTDNIFFLNRFVGLLKKQFPSVVGNLEDPIYHMLPLASIVACAHHSLLEVALAMSINDVNDYRIGLYSTLMPFQSRHPAQGRIMSVLQRAESNLRNRLMVLYYRRPGTVGGCYLFAKHGRERQDFARLAKADLNMLSTFAASRTYPTQDNIEHFMCARARRSREALGLA